MSNTVYMLKLDVAYEGSSILNVYAKRDAAERAKTRWESRHIKIKDSVDASYFPKTDKWCDSLYETDMEKWKKLAVGRYHSYNMIPEWLDYTYDESVYIQEVSVLG